MDKKLLKQLRRVGVTTFIKYYDVFKQNKDSDTNDDIFAAFDAEKEKWNTNSYKTKASVGKTIFRNNQHIEVLQHIIENVKKIDPATLDEAKRIYQRENS